MPKINLSGMSVEALMDLRKRVDGMLLERRAELQKQLETIAVVGGRRVVRGGGSALRGRKVPPKYRGRSGETWAGRGANASAPPNICSSLPWTEKAPARRGVGASRGESRQSGSKVRPFPLCREHWAEHFLSGVVAETGTCSSLPKICLLKPRKPADMGPVAYSRPLGSEPREGPHQGCSESQHR